MITGITNIQQLEEIHTSIQSKVDLVKYKDVNMPNKMISDTFEKGKINLRKGVSKDQIFAEQGHTPISFTEVQEIMTDEPWEQSLDEVLANLN